MKHTRLPPFRDLRGEFIQKSRNLTDRIRAFSETEAYRESTVLTRVAVAPFLIITAITMALGFITFWFLVFFILVCVISLGFLLVLRPGRGDASKRIWDHVERIGFGLFVGLLIIAGIAIFLRITMGRTAFGIFYSLGTLALVISYLKKEESGRQFKAFIGLALGPIFFAWLSVSLAYAVVTLIQSLKVHNHEAWNQTLEERRNRISKWEGPVVAVTLSGGGYRAAVAHAGLLWVLDHAEIPIRVISSVSGGSIVAAAYACGWEPEDFKNYLASKRPGLPNDLFNILPLLVQLIWPSWGSGETYALHFQRVYFHFHTLKETGPPDLILNATSFNQGKHESFWSDERHGERRLATLVAASGAFPVAFDPVQIDEDQYIDGGVFENLGLEGLSKYLNESKRPRTTPGVLIISDLSAEQQTPRRSIKPSPLEVAKRAQEVPYSLLHQRIYDQYTNENYRRNERNSTKVRPQPYCVSAGRLWPGRDGTVVVFVLSPTSSAERWRFVDQEPLVESVSNLDTLKELSQREVEAAFWVGAKLAADYMPKLCEILGIVECPSIRPPAPTAVP